METKKWNEANLLSLRGLRVVVISIAKSHTCHDIEDLKVKSKYQIWIYDNQRTHNLWPRLLHEILLNLWRTSAKIACCA